MTYQQLLNQLSEFTPEQLQMDVTIYDPSSEEYFGIGNLRIAIDNDVLDNGHLYVELKQ